MLGKKLSCLKLTSKHESGEYQFYTLGLTRTKPVIELESTVSVVDATDKHLTTYQLLQHKTMLNTAQVKPHASFRLCSSGATIHVTKHLLSLVRQSDLKMIN